MIKSCIDVINITPRYYKWSYVDISKKRNKKSSFKLFFRTSQKVKIYSTLTTGSGPPPPK